jgi:hypothetical protein
MLYVNKKARAHSVLSVSGKRNDQATRHHNRSTSVQGATFFNETNPVYINLIPLFRFRFIYMAIFEPFMGIKTL